MLTIWDYIVIGFYLVFMLTIGFVWSRASKNSSDFFRGGGNMLWWINGMSSLAAGLTAYSFTAAGAKVFETGFFLILIYLAGLFPMLIVYFFFAARYRQMRAVTVCDVIRRRYGKPTEQFWVWTALPLGLFGGGMMLYIVALFVSAAIGIPIVTTIVILAATVTIMAASGGAWAVAASDFIQMMIIIVVSITVLVRSLKLPEIGGLSGFIDKLPQHYTDFSTFERPAVWMALLSMFVLMNIIRAIDLNNQGAKYLTVKDGKHAKRATMVMIIGTAIVPLVAFAPVMVAGILNLNLAEMFPAMKNPSEGAYLAIAQRVMPTGMVGLMVCSIFAATMSSMDTVLNKNAGFFVRNFYRDILKPNASEKHLLWMGKSFSLIFGVIVAVVAVLISMYRGADLFSMLLRLNVLLGYPMVVPMTMGLLFKRTPGWSAWSTVIVAATVAWLSQQYLTADMVAGIVGLEMPLNALEAKDIVFISSGLITISAGMLWFFGTMLFYRQTTTEAYRESVDGIFKDMVTPIDHAVESDGDQDGTQYKNMSMISLIYGGALCLGFLIPNTFNDRLVFIWCGGVFVIIGTVLQLIYRKRFCE